MISWTCNSHHSAVIIFWHQHDSTKAFLQNFVMFVELFQCHTWTILWYMAMWREGPWPQSAGWNMDGCIDTSKPLKKERCFKSWPVVIYTILHLTTLIYNSFNQDLGFGHGQGAKIVLPSTRRWFLFTAWRVQKSMRHCWIHWFQWNLTSHGRTGPGCGDGHG